MRKCDRCKLPIEDDNISPYVLMSGKKVYICQDCIKKGWIKK